MEDLRMKLWANTIIMRTILSNLDWRDLQRFALVCRLWRDAVKSLQLVNLRSYEFAMVRYKLRWAVRHKFMLRVGNDLPVQTQPMCAIGFYRFVDRILRCEDFFPVPCEPPCATGHTYLEIVYAKMVSKNSCLLGAGGLLIYEPIPTSRTIHKMDQDCALVGLYLPKIPNVNYHNLQYQTDRIAQENFYSDVDKICTTDIIKGVVVFVGVFVWKIDEVLQLLNYIKVKQPSEPYALGGSVEWKGLMRKGYVTMGVFSVPKMPQEAATCSQFNMYSLIMDSAVEEKAAIQKVIQTFAVSFSELQYSAALQLSTFKRTQSYTFEPELFRAAFPRTAIVGCCNERVLGFNHPEQDIRDICPIPAKRTNTPSRALPEDKHTNSTVYVYFTWG